MESDRSKHLEPPDVSCMFFFLCLLFFYVFVYCKLAVICRVSIFFLSLKKVLFLLQIGRAPYCKQY